MQIKYFIIVFSLFDLTFFVIARQQENFQLIDQLKQEVNPYQITVFDTNSTSNNSKKSEFVGALSSNIPTVIIDPSSPQSNRSLNLQVHKNPRAARVTYLILQDNFNVEEARNIIDIITKLSPVPTRPKCILVHFDHQQHSYDKILSYTWTLKFLDFIITRLEFNDYVSYNPFFDETTYTKLNTTAKLFPDKLRNINKHPLLVPFCDNPPFLLAKIDNVTGTKSISGTVQKPIELFVSQINGTIQYVDMESLLQYKPNQFFGNLSKGTISLGEIPAVSSYFYNRSVVLSKLHLTSEISLVVPVLSYSILNFPSNLIACLICSLAIILSFKLAASALKLSFRDWTTFDVIQLFLGISLSKPIDKLPERLIALSVVLISMKISSDLIGAFAEVKILKEEIPLNDFDDFRYWKIPVYTLPSFKDRLFKDNQQVISKINMTECYVENEKGEAAVCIGAQFNTIFSLQRYKNARMKVVKPALSTDFIGYPFEKASPYVEKFNEFMTKLIEASLFDKFFPKFKKEKLELQELLINESSIADVLMSILAIGYSIAGVVFVAEIFVHPRGINVGKKCFSNII